MLLSSRCVCAFNHIWLPPVSVFVPAKYKHHVSFLCVCVETLRKPSSGCLFDLWVLWWESCVWFLCIHCVFVFSLGKTSQPLCCWLNFLPQSSSRRSIWTFIWMKSKRFSQSFAQVKVCKSCQGCKSVFCQCFTVICEITGCVWWLLLL